MWNGDFIGPSRIDELREQERLAKEEQLDKLKAHAELTIKKLESMLKRRGITTGKKVWEVELLKSAYLALGLEPTKHEPGLVW